MAENNPVVSMATSMGKIRIELDPERATALLANLPSGQVVITSASPLPAAAKPDRVLEIAAGTVVRR